MAAHDLGMSWKSEIFSVSCVMECARVHEIYPHIRLADRQDI
ncbi:hypothetical protein S101447_02057 [Acetobacter ascendens]|uniref:Uncharacterized protein n=1 Tax=Acetobacter ascendens TaxID=481146 RepID=A0A1Y0UZG2_9PROT|nr:hypothetical protein S101447_02057 [Acetobacter ascendens]